MLFSAMSSHEHARLLFYTAGASSILLSGSFQIAQSAIRSSYKDDKDIRPSVAVFLASCLSSLFNATITSGFAIAAAWSIFKSADPISLTTPSPTSLMIATGATCGYFVAGMAEESSVVHPRPPGKPLDPHSQPCAPLAPPVPSAPRPKGRPSRHARHLHHCCTRLCDHVALQGRVQERDGIKWDASHVGASPYLAGWLAIRCAHQPVLRLRHVLPLHRTDEHRSDRLSLLQQRQVDWERGFEGCWRCALYCRVQYHSS